MQILEVNDLRKVYTTRFGGQQVEALRCVTFSVAQGEYWPSWANPARVKPRF